MKYLYLLLFVVTKFVNVGVTVNGYIFEVICSLIVLSRQLREL